MSFDLQGFYRQLDESYAALDRNATEAFLLASREKAFESQQPELLRDGCPACAPQVAPNGALIAVCNELACFYRGLSRWEESLEAFGQAQEELEQYYQNDTVQYATILLNKAGTYRYMNKPQKALELFEQAEKILSQCENVPLGILAGLYNNTGLALLDLKRPQDALERFQNALPLISGNAQSIVEQGSTWNNIAAAHRSLGNFHLAIDAMDRSIAILEKLDCGRNPHYPAALNTRGICHYQQGCYEAALADFTAALEITALVYGENIEYAYGCDNCSAACQKMGRLEDARSWQKKSNTIRERLGR